MLNCGAPGQAIIYDTIQGLADGLRCLAAHPAVAVVRVKNRFARNDPAHAAAAGGYRDVAVNLRLEGPAGGGHVCEVQLLLLAVAQQRSEAGHQRYIAFRNAMGT